MPGALRERIHKARRDLDLKEVDYEGTMAAKLSIARDLFDQQGHCDLQVDQLFLLSFDRCTAHMANAGQQGRSTVHQAAALSIIITTWGIDSHHDCMIKHLSMQQHMVRQMRLSEHDNPLCVCRHSSTLRGTRGASTG